MPTDTPSKAVDVRPDDCRVPIAVSARHVHLTLETMRTLFGNDYRLHVHCWLSQPGHFSAEETVALVGPKGRVDHVRVVGPPRVCDQVELSRSDEHVLGINAPVRVSGDVEGTPGLTVVGPKGEVALSKGVITACRHIHMSPAQARSLGLSQGDEVGVRVVGTGRDLVFNDVVVRVAEDFRLQLHLDTDEANAAGVESGDFAELLLTRGRRIP